MDAASPTPTDAPAVDGSHERPSRLRRLFGIDRRSLVAFRVSFGLLMVSEFVKRGLALQAHYTDQGVLPRAVVREFLPDPLVFQAFLWSGSTWYVALLFGLAIVLGLMVVVGWHAQLATLVFLWLQVSVRLRNPFVNHTGDDYLTVITLFACFLPYSHHLSLDRLRKPWLPTLPRTWLAVGSAAILLQIAAFYVGAGVDKHHFPVWTEGRAVSYFAVIDQYTRPLGAMLGDYPGLCRFGTYFTLALEIGGPLLMFSPFFTPWLRILVVFLLVGFHLGIQAVVYIGIFELVSISAALLFLPGEFWDLLGRLPPCAWLARKLAPLERADPGAPTHRPWVLAEVLAGLCIAVVLYSNAHSYVHRRPGPLPRGTFNKLSKLLQLKQSWQIFADIDANKTGWFLALGRRPGGSLVNLRGDGSLVNLWNGEPFTGFEKPPGFAADFPNHNFRRLWHTMRFVDRSVVRPHLAAWLIRRWNAAHPEDPVDGMLILWIDPQGGVDDPRKREPLLVYEAERGPLAAEWWMPAVPFALRMPR